MALTTITRRFISNQNKRAAPGGDGDLVTAIYDIDVATGPNAYPAGGEPIDFTADFREVHAVSLGRTGASGLGPWDARLRMPVFERTGNAVGDILIFVGPGNAAGFPQHAAGVYASDFAFSLIVVGRPASDVS